MTDKNNKNNYLLLMGDLNVRIRSQGLSIIKGTKREQNVNSKWGEKLTDLR